MEHEERCEFLIKQVHDAVGRVLNNSLRESGLTHVQLGVLIALNKSDGKRLRLKEIEKIFKVSQPTVVGVVDRLEEKGFVRTLRDPEDRRVRLAELTEKGSEKCRHEYELLLATEAKMLQGIEPEAIRQIKEILVKMRENLK